VIRVTARTILHLATLLGSREVQLEVPADSSVMDVLARLAGRMGEQSVPALLEVAGGRPQRHLRIMLNGRDIGFLGGLDAVVQEGDEILVLPPAGGG
jgi:molybdopterin synthase sulfur carrier subunit